MPRWLSPRFLLVLGDTLQLSADEKTKFMPSDKHLHSLSGDRGRELERSEW